eukprot:737472-Amphidinium_carterae.1
MTTWTTHQTLQPGTTVGMTSATATTRSMDYFKTTLLDYLSTSLVTNHTSDMRAIDDSEALKVWSELSKLDPKIPGDTYVTEDG